MKRILVILLCSVFMLLLLGVVMLYSATETEEVPHRVYMHLLWIGLGTICAVAVSCVHYQRFRNPKLLYPLVALSLLALVAVLVPGISEPTNGARRWLPFGGQPSELAKLALILFLADYTARHQARMHEYHHGFLYPMIFAGTIVGLVFLEPDWGTAILLGSVTAAMLLMAGTRWVYLVTSGLSIIFLLGFLVSRDPLRMARLISFLDPEKYQHGVGWQGWHSVLSIGVGGFCGNFFGDGSMKMGFVPEQQTDFIFSLIGEELGFFGTTLVLLLFISIVSCGLRLAWRLADPFAQLLTAGLTFLIGFQAFINIGVVTSSLPNKGIPLPFVSYGGSNLVIMLLCIGVLASIARHAPIMPKTERLKGTIPPENVFSKLAWKRMRPSNAAACPANPSTRWNKLLFWKRRPCHPRFYFPPRHSYQRPPQPRAQMRLESI